MESYENSDNKLLIWLKKHLILVLGVVILIIVALFFLLQPEDDIKFELYGASQVNIYLGGEYYEYGYYLSDKEYSVDVISNVDTNRVGTYMVKYRLTKNGKFKLEKVRRVVVVEDALKNVTLTLNGEKSEYVLLNNIYNDTGAKAIYNGSDISQQVIKTGSVDTSTVGNYEIKYTIKMDGREKTISRFVRVFDMIFESDINYSNKIIDVNVVSYDFDYVLLPDGNKTTKEDFTFKYTKSGIHKFTVYTKKGYSKSFEVNVLDKTKPTGSCKAKINGNNTEVEITANDEGGISKYTYGTQIFTSNKFTINQKLTKFLIRIYDNGDNYIDVECKTRRTFDNNMDEIKLSSTLTPCHSDWSKYNSELANLVLEYGSKTRDAVAASADYLARFPYKVAYSWGGKSKTPGINYEWGCSKHVSLHDGRLVCTKETGAESCIYGMDCAGYTAWAYINAGFDPSIIRTSGQSEGMWGNFNAAKHTYKFNSANASLAAKIKPGDIVHDPGHVGIVIGTSDTMLKVANMVGGIKITYIKKSNGASTNSQHSFADFVLMDDFFEMYGNKYE